VVNGDLPKGWERMTLGEVTQINGRDAIIRDLPDDLPVTFLPMAAVDAERGVIAQPEVRPLKAVRKGFTPFSDGDVLFAKITPSMENGKAAIARNLYNGRGFGSTEFHVLKPKIPVTAEWIFYFIRQENFRKDAKAHFAGTAGQLRVPASFLVDYPIPIPPLPEQERIVGKIEELFTQLESGTAALRRVQAGLKRYKASVLKAAVEGRLVDGGEKVKEGELPEGWRWVKFAEITSQIKDVDHKMPKPADSEIPYISTKDFIGDEDIDFNNAKHISEEDYNALSRKIKPELNDILISRYGTVGAVRKVKTSRKFQASYSIAIVKPNLEEVSPDFLVTVLHSEIGQDQMRKSIRASSQPDLGLEYIRKFDIPFPPLPEQLRIVGEVERRLSVAQEIEAVVEASMKRAARLRQAVLKAAFEGTFA
jgi:type I restriction enzyme, S subunit